MRFRHLALLGVLTLPTFSTAQTTPTAATPKASTPKAATPTATPAASQKAATPAAAPKPATSAGTTAPKPAGTTAAKPAAKPAVPAKPKEMTDEQKTIYALGLSMSRSLKPFDLSPAEIDLIKQALVDAAAKKPAVDLDTWGPKIQGLAEARGVIATQKEKANSAAYLAKAATEPGAIKTDSGIVYKELTPGTGASPAASDTVKVHYRGTLIDGTEFDSSYKRNSPAEFPLTGVIKCWTEGVQKIRVGGKSRLVCPSDLAYGDQGRPSIPGGAALIFEIELLEIPSQPGK
jgi:FKBP-type peptidyl-prolyl cis-trans isomerase FkpA